MKVAKLVTIELTARVIADETSTDDEILELAKPKFTDKVDAELNENIVDIKNDTECPFGTMPGEK